MMSILRLAAVLFAAQSSLSSAAVVHSSYFRASAATEKAESVTFSESIWNNTMTRFVEHEIMIEKAEPKKVDKVFYVMFAMMFGCCGCDRCFMGQILYGCLKGFTFGGFLIWHIIDYFTCVYCALAKMEKIDMMGYDATFKPSSIEPAFIACIIFLILNIFQQIQAYRNHKVQMEAQAEMFKALNEQNAGVASNPGFSPPQQSLNVPLRQQSLAHIPTPLTKALRKAGVVQKEATIPELICAFQAMDIDGDGQVDRDELKKALDSMGVSDEDIDEMVKEADTDKDGKISKDEFLAYHAKKAAEKAAKKAAKAEEEKKADP